MNKKQGNNPKIQKNWIVRNKKNQIRGPFSTQEVLNFINDSVFNGEESVAQYPEGTWVIMSTVPEFYDGILKQLEKPNNESSTLTNKKVTQETVIVPPPASVNKNKPIVTNKNKVDLHAKDFQTATPIVLPKNDAQKKANNEIIELKRFKGIKIQEAFKQLKIPILAFFGVLLAIATLLYFENDGADDKIHLLAPGKSSEALSETQIKERIQLAVRAMEKDNFQNYLEAQNILVTTIEGSPRSLQPRGLLCFVYKELWPYAKQDAQDQKTMDQIVHGTKAINLVDPHGVLCEIVKMTTAGRVKEARGATDSLLELGEQFNLHPLLFEIKAELLELEKDYSNAIPYFEKASQLWPTWAKPKAMLAWTYYNAGNSAKAIENFQTILKQHPQHKFSLIGIGIIESKSYNQNEIAFTHLTAGFESAGKVPRGIESEGLESLAEIYMLKNKKSVAQKLACRSLEISPSRKEAKEICARLGGEIKSNRKSLYAETVFMGDQYMRAGDYLSAQAEFKAAFELQPKIAEAAIKAAKCLWSLNQSGEAIDWLTKAIHAEPRNVSSYVLQADYLSQRYDFANADQALSLAAKVAANNYEVFRGMSLVAFRKNDFSTAINFGLRATRAFDGDAETYIVLSKASRELASKIRLGDEKEIEQRNNLTKDAIRYATKAVELDATNPETQANFAKMLANTSGIDSGINYANELIKRYAFNSEYKIALAEILMNEDRYSQAAEVLEQVISFENKNKKALLFLGISYRATGQSDRALTTFLKAAVIDPTDAEPIFQMGRIYLDLAKYDEALQQFQRVLKINVNYPRTYYFLAKTSFASGNLSEAADQVNQEKKLYPRLPDSYVLSAEIHAARQKYSDCSSEYSKAIGLGLQTAEVYVKAARCYRLSGSLDLAEDMLTLAKERESGYADIFREQGFIFQSRGKNIEAIKAYEMYLELSPNATDRNDIKAQMSKLGG